MGNLVPEQRQVRRKDGTVYQAVRHVKMTEAEPGKKGWNPPQIGSNGIDQLAYANIHNSLSRRGFDDSNISFAIDVAVSKLGMDASKLSATKIMAALNDCADALGDENYSFANSEHQNVATRIVTASLQQLPASPRVQKLVQDPDVDLDHLIRLIKEDGITDPAKLEIVLQGGAKSLSDGAL